MVSSFDRALDKALTGISPLSEEAIKTCVALMNITRQFTLNGLRRESQAEPFVGLMLVIFEGVRNGQTVEEIVKGLMRSECDQ